MSHWFYLLAEGGTATNDKNQQYCVKSIGKDKAIKIAYESLFYLGGTSKQFSDARFATISAAQSLYGNNSDEVLQATNAWYAVGVGAQYSGQINLQNIVITSQYDIHYNAKVSIQNLTVNTGPLTVTSNTEIELLPGVDINQGGLTQLYIDPACF